eukprot:gene8138-9693_t
MQSKTNVELSSAASSVKGESDVEDSGNDKQQEIKKALVGQTKVPVYQKPHFWSPDFVKCDGKIIKYDLRALGIWRALVSCSHTIITDYETWQHLGCLVLVGVLTALFVVFTGLNKSIGEGDPVTARISLLISFILSGYITITVNRWDRIRNGTLGALWGALENLNMVAQRILLTNSTKPGSFKTRSFKDGTELELAEELIRLSRLTLILTFKAVQDLGEADVLVGLLNQELVTEEERQWLLATTPGTRPLLVVSWMEGYIGTLQEKGYTIPRHLNGLAGMQLNNIRGGIGATLGAIGAQLPYPYVHLVYWTVQCLLGITAIQQGCDAGVKYYSKINGDGQYSPDTGTWPEHPNTWYMGQILANLAGSLIFALFCEGIMNICAKISNPMALTDIAFSERAYASFMYNNCKALRAGIYSYDHLRHPVVLGPRTRTGSGGGSLGGSPVVTGKSLAGLNKQENRSNKNDGGSVANKKSTELPVLGALSTNTEGAIIGLAVGLTS